jgi:hypothetical protein
MTTVRLSGDVAIHDREVYEALVYGDRDADREFGVTVEYEQAEPTRRVVLWGARGDDVQAGSSGDWLQRLLAYGPLKLTLPRVAFGEVVRS